MAVTLTIPWAIHYIGGFLNLADSSVLGKMFLPMHIGVFITAMFYGWKEGLTIGLTAPLISFMVTGMPVSAPFPMLQIMTIELALYGLVTGLVYNYLKKRENLKKYSQFMAILSGMIIGRLGVALVLYFSIISIKSPVFSFAINGIKTGIIGILIQMILIPFVIKAYKK
ncbi:MAG: hypothetical protein BWY64_03570 [bacterium ADurb.Bin363]|nr:MAG: hypothetical protein BWY64_03570 [bacterium ADurb.Bin363]